MKKCSKKDKSESSFKKGGGVRLCSNCFSRIYKGSNHSETNCKSKRYKIDNLENAAGDDALEKLARNTIESLVHQSGDNSCYLKSQKGGKHAALVTIGKAKESEAQSLLSLEDLIVLQCEANLSDRYCSEYLLEFEIIFDMV